MHPTAAVALQGLIGDPPKVDVHVLEALAEHAHEARAGEGAEGLVEGQDAEVQFDDGLPDGHDGIALSDGLLIVRPSRDRATERLRILHELAHWMLMQAGCVHSHSDVWLLTFALGAPKSLMRRERPNSAVGLAAASGIPVDH